MDLNDAGKYRKALAIYDKLIKKTPLAQVYFERAMTLLNLERDQEAAQDLEKALQMEPNFPGAQDWLARAQAGLGKPALAAEIKLKELLAKPISDDWSASPQSWADCSQYFVEAGEPQRAIEVLERYFREYEAAVKAYACYTTAPWRLYSKLMLPSNPDLALEYARRAAAHLHHCPADQFTLMRALEVTNPPQARAELEKMRTEWQGHEWFEVLDQRVPFYTSNDPYGS